MIGEIGEKQEEERLIIKLSKSEEREREATETEKMEATAELAGAYNELAEFYEGTNNNTKAREYYKKTIQEYKNAIQLSSKQGSVSSGHIYTKLKNNATKSLKRIGGNNEGIIRKINNKGILATAIICLIGGLALMFKITGNVISSISSETTSYLGLSLFMAGLLTCLFWLKNKN